MKQLVPKTFWGKATMFCFSLFLVLGGAWVFANAVMKELATIQCVSAILIGCGMTCILSIIIFGGDNV